jgi:hypothetical protein
MLEIPYDESDESGAATPEVAKPFIRMAGLLFWILNAVGIIADVDDLTGDWELWENHAAVAQQFYRNPNGNP